MTATLFLMLSLISAAAIGATGESRSRAEKLLDAEMRRLESEPTSAGAEVSLLIAFGLWDLAGPGSVMAALESAAQNRSLNQNARDRAKHLIAQGTMRLGDPGRASAMYQEMGMIRSWAVIGPFDNEGGTGFDTSFPPEATPAGPYDPAARIPGKVGDLFWREAPAMIAPFGYNHLEALYDPDINICSYAVALLDSPKTGDALLRVGAGGAVKAFWNGSEAISDNSYRRPDLDRSAARVKVYKGANRLLVKVCAKDGGDLGFYARVTDKNGRPWPLSADAKQVESLTSISPAGPKPVRVPQTLDKLRTSVESNPKDAQMIESLARFIAQTGAQDRAGHDARDFAKKACELVPSAMRCLLWAELAIDGNERAVAIGRARDAEPESVEAIVEEARLKSEDFEPTQALGMLKEVKGDPEADSLELEILAGSGLVVTASEKALSLFQLHPEIPMLAELAFQLAENSGRASNGLFLAEKRLETMFTDLPKHEILARAAAARSDKDDLERHLFAISAMAPCDSEKLAFAAGLLEGAGDLEAAEDRLRTRISLAPDQAEAWKDLGLFLIRNGHKQQGVDALGRAAEITPQDAWLSDYLNSLRPAFGLEERFAVPPESFLAERTGDCNGEDARYLVDSTAVQVFESGLSSRLVQIAVEIKNRDAARMWRFHQIYFSPDSQRIKVLAARLFRKNGSVENAVGRNTVQVSEPWYRLYYDIEAEVIELPTARCGDVVEILYRIDDTAHRNAFNDYFGDFELIQDSSPKNHWRYALVSPVSRRFHFNDITGKLRAKRSVEGDTSIEVFETNNVPAVEEEMSMAGLTSGTSYLHVSTYSSWQEMGRWYFRELVQQQMTPDAALRSKIDELIRGLKDERKKVEAIYGWVVGSVRYVGLEFGIYGYKPYRSPVVLSRGFGDCKDKAALLVSMLQLAGIDAKFALIRTRHLGDIENEPASLAVFNHAIAYVPSLGLWLDGTAEHHGVDDLPFQDQDAPTLVLSPDRAEFMRTPVQPASRNSTKETVNVLLDPDGEARIESNISVIGSSAVLMRREMEAESTRRERFETSLAAIYPGARLGDLDFSSISDTSLPVSYRFTAFVPSFGKASSNGIKVPGDPGLDLISTYGRLPSRKHALELGPPISSSRETTLLIPEGFETEMLPPEAEIESKYGKLSLRVSESKGEIKVSRLFEMSVHEIAVDEYPALVDFFRKVDDALAGRIALRRKR